MRERVRSVLQGPAAVALLILAAGAALVGVAVARTSRAPSSPPAVSRPGAPVRAAAHPSSATPCGTTRRRPTWQHVVWVVMENRDYGGIVGTGAAPYVNRLGRKCGVATRFSAETHPSLPNYIAMTSGSTQGISDDADPSAHRLSVPSIFSQLGGGWRSLHESMPGNCAATPSGLYAVKHNPAAYYTNVASACAAQDVPLMSPPGLSARFTFVKPNLCNDTHDCSVDRGDAWMAGFIPKILNSPQYRAGSTAVFITWDEGTNANRIPTFVIAPSTRRGTLSATAFSHYSLLRTTEEMLGLPLLGNASKAASMRSAFHL
jgi:phosphatidylinositol-3-phosphatase